MLDDQEVERRDYSSSLMHLILQVTLKFTNMILKDSDRAIMP